MLIFQLVILTLIFKDKDKYGWFMVQAVSSLGLYTRRQVVV
jgi:hypothetical protein